VKLRWAWAALAIGTALVGGMRWCRAQDKPIESPHTTLMLDELLLELDALADTATLEHFRCLLGQRIGDSLLVVGAWEPEIYHADYNGVRYGPCPPTTVGTWHNHLPYNIPMNNPHDRSNRVEPWSVCDLSPLDRRSATREPSPILLSVIGVAKGVHCAWMRTREGELVRLPWLAN